MTNLDNKIKEATELKLLEETARLRAERLKIEKETELLTKEERKPWWKKTDLLKIVVAIFVGAPFLGFYIDRVIIPMAKTENIKLEMKNAQEEQRLSEKEAELYKGNLKLQEANAALKSSQKQLLVRDNFINNLYQRKQVLSDQLTQAKNDKQRSDYITLELRAINDSIKAELKLAQKRFEEANGKGKLKTQTEDPMSSKSNTTIPEGYMECPKCKGKPFRMNSKDGTTWKCYRCMGSGIIPSDGSPVMY